MLAFGSVVAAGLPIVVALGGLPPVRPVTLLAAVTDVSTSAPIVASMVGLGVGIDYSCSWCRGSPRTFGPGMPSPMRRV